MHNPTVYLSCVIQADTKAKFGQRLCKRFGQLLEKKIIVKFHKSFPNVALENDTRIVHNLLFGQRLEQASERDKIRAIFDKRTKIINFKANFTRFCQIARIFHLNIHSYALSYYSFGQRLVYKDSGTFKAVRRIFSVGGQNCFFW